MFLLSRHASGGDRSPWGSFWFEPVGMRSSTGVRVTSAAAMRLSAVYSCVRVLAETFAVLPFCLYKVGSNGARTPVKDHWLYQLFARSPNPWQTPFEWREMMMGHLALRGNAFNQLVVNGRGEIEQFIPLHPDRVKIELLDNGNFRYQVSQRDGSTLTLLRGQVWHLRGLSSDGFIGLNPIELASDVLGMGLAAQTYGARFFANDAKPGGWLELPGKFADEPTRAAFKASWKSAQGGANRGATAVLEQGMKYHELTLNNSDSQFLELRQFSRSEIASMFRVPPHMIGDLDRATFSNIEQQSLDFVMHTVTPWAERWESSIETFLLFDGDDLEVEFDFANLLRGDSAARSTYYNKLFAMGALSPNDIRIREGAQPIANGDKYFVPLNMVSLETAGQPQAKKGVRPAPVPADQSIQDPVEDPADARATALARSAAARVARKEAAMLAPLMTIMPAPVEQIATAMAKHAEFVSATLAVSAQAAQGYVQARGRDPIRQGSEEADIYAAAFEKLQTLALKGTL